MNISIFIFGLIIFVILVFLFSGEKNTSTPTRSSGPSGKPKDTGSHGNISRCNNGLMVRSKAEKILADVFTKKGIEFIYEKDLYINGRKVGNPDFFLPKYNCYVEYFGLMNNAAYKSNAIFKMNSFRQNSILCADIYPEDITAYSKNGKKFYSSEKLEKSLIKLLNRRFEKRQNIMHVKG